MFSAEEVAKIIYDLLKLYQDHLLNPRLTDTIGEFIRLKACHDNPDEDFPYKKISKGSAHDVFSNENVMIQPNQTVAVPTGWRVSRCPKTHCLELQEKSGLSLSNIFLHGGLIDSDYRGQIHVILHNSSEYPHHIDRGAPIANIKVVKKDPLPMVFNNLMLNDVATDCPRGERGFGQMTEDVYYSEDIEIT